MNNDYVLWGTKVGAPEWHEEILWVTQDAKLWAERIAHAKEWATSQGYDRLRTKVFGDSDVPQFGRNVLNV
jgi:hypothetical protein